MFSVAVPNSYLLALVDAGYLEDDDSLIDHEAVRTAIEASLSTAQIRDKKHHSAVRVLHNTLNPEGKMRP